LIRYSEKIFDLSENVIARIWDRRECPCIPTPVIVKGAVALFWARLGSLNALETVATASLWKKWLGQSIPSADTMGRVYALTDLDGLREGIHRIYERLKRNKALPDIGGLGVAALDGHESHASYRRHCSGCLERTISTKHGDRTQYYHRNVTLMLLPGSRPGLKPIRFLLDAEAQRPGEDEVAVGLRLLKRVIAVYPRAFDLVLADALYATAPFFNFLLSLRKHALVVLKDDRRNIYQDVAGLLNLVTPVPGQYRGRDCSWWDFQGLLSWPEVNAPLRVVRSEETYSVRRQLDRELSEETSEWMWVTTLPQAQASTERTVSLGHQRWDIENYGFNELVRGWHADHVYKHDSNAIEAFLLTVFLAYNLFHAFITLNLKPQIRQGKTEIYWARLLAAELYAGTARFASGPSP
jgi:hypothetical protein